MKLAVCDRCGEKEEFTDKCPLLTKEICTKCYNTEPIVESIVTDRPITMTTLSLAPSPSIEFTKNNLTGAKEGLVISNIDNVFYNYHNKGLAIVEYKSRNQKPYITSYGQWSIYERMDKAFKSDPNYLGTFVVWSDEYDLERAKEYKINGTSVNKEQLVEFMELKRKDYIGIDFKDFNAYKSTMEKRN